MPSDANNPVFSLEAALPNDRLPLLRRASAACANEGAELYLAGGAVRDILFGRGTDGPDLDLDLDLVMVGASDSAQSAVAERIGSVISRSEFMTVKVQAGGIEVDLVRARAETYARPGALPTVRPGTLSEDLARRDFTINAMAVSLNPGSWGSLVDPAGGQADLELGVVRTLHDRSFIDDPTRIFRAVRYAGRLGFAIEPTTRGLLDEGLPYVGALSGDRVRHEIERIFAEPSAPAILRLARQAGVLAAVHAEFGQDAGALERIAASDVPGGPARGAALLAALVWSGSHAGRLAIRDRLRMGADWSRVVVETGELHGAAAALSPGGAAASRLRKTLGGFGEASLEAYAALTTNAAFRAAVRSYLDCLRHVRPALTGDDLLALGVPRGPEVGRLLGALLDARLDGLLETLEDEERWVRESL